MKGLTCEILTDVTEAREFAWKHYKFKQYCNNAVITRFPNGDIFNVLYFQNDGDGRGHSIVFIGLKDFVNDPDKDEIRMFLQKEMFDLLFYTANLTIVEGRVSPHARNVRGLVEWVFGKPAYLYDNNGWHFNLTKEEYEARVSFSGIENVRWSI